MKTPLLLQLATNVSIIAYITKRQLLTHDYISTKIFFLSVGLSNITADL